MNKNSKVKEWYKSEFPDDDYGNYIRDELTFKDVYRALEDGKDMYDAIFDPASGHFDSVVRERIFYMLPEIYTELDDDKVYNMWMSGDDDINESVDSNKETTSHLIVTLSNQLSEASHTLDQIEMNFEELGIHSADIQPYFGNYLAQFAELEDVDPYNMSCATLKDRLEEADINESVQGKTCKNHINSLSKLLKRDFGKGTAKHEGNFRFTFKTDKGRTYDIITSPVDNKEGEDAKKIKVDKVLDVTEESCKTNKLGKKVRKITEGAGAGYDVFANDYSVVEFNKIAITKVDELEDYVTVTFDDCDIDVTCHVEGESYYDGGIVPNAQAKITKLVMDVDRETYEEEKEKALRPTVEDNILSLVTKSKQGGGWFHKTFTGVLAATEDDVQSSMSITQIVVNMTNQEQITFLDKGIDDGNKFVQYSVFKDGESLDAFEDEDEAVKYAKDNDCDFVEAQGFCQTEFGGDVEEIPDDVTTVWSKEDNTNMEG